MSVTMPFAYPILWSQTGMVIKKPSTLGVLKPSYRKASSEDAWDSNQ
jgi:hypothetical protein